MAGRTNKQLAAGQVRSLRALRERILNMARQWEDLDQFLVNELVALADHLETVSLELKNAE